MLNRQLHKLHFERCAAQIQSRHSYRQLKPARAGTSWIDVEHTVAFESSRLMGMPADDDMETSRRRVYVESMQIMENIKEDSASFGHRCLGQRPSPIGGVHVSPHGYDGSEFPKRSKNFGFAHITGMKNQLRTSKGFQRLRAQQTVGV